jgi:hypothetical protein
MSHDHVFFLGTHRLHAPQERMTVSSVKALIAQHVTGFNVANTLVREEQGDRPDMPLNDNDEVHIHDFPHFYDQPPATFG